MVANLTDKNRYKKENIETLIQAQIENSLESHWAKKDIILLTNFDYEFLDIKSINSIIIFC